MESTIMDKLKKMVIENLEDDIESINLDDGIENAGINSITFVKIVVCIESEFDIEFDEDSLDLSNFPTIESLAAYVEKKLNEKEQ